MNFPICSFLASAILFFGAANGRAIQPLAQAALPNLDRRTEGAWTNNVTTGNRQAAVERLQTRLPKVKVEFDQVSGSPRFISAGDQFLSGTNGQGKAISAAAAAKFATDAYRPTKAFVQDHRELFGHGPEALEKARVKSEFIAPRSGLKTVVWEQAVDDIPLFESVFISHTTAKGELVNVCSQFLPDPEAAADRGVTNRVAVVADPKISARQAVVIAAQNIVTNFDAQGIIPDQEANGAAVAGPEKRQFFTGPGLMGKADAKLIWLPMSQDRLRLCWDVTLMSRARGEMFRVLVDTQTGEPLIRRCLTDYISDATYRVYTSDSPSPLSPTYGTPVTNQPPLTSRVLVTLPALDTNASPNGWINDGGNETLGNNVDAHTDRNADNVADLPRPQGSPFRVFDFPMDLAQSPATYTNAAVVQLFYWNNFMHDKLYALGFTEAAGNFQSSNFGRGGLGNDAVQADAQDGSGFNNANFSTPPDGSPGRMQMYLFNATTPNRDGDLDAEVVLHEYTHGLSNRRVGGGVGISANQSAGMGEGWSDFYAMALLSEPGDDVNGVYASGGYVTYQLSGLTQNYYFGIRRYPYCTDMNKNPLTFKDIDPAQASAHTGIPRNPIIGTTANEVHNEGEVWCMTLREARANLINKYGWAVGNQLILQLVTDGMTLSPANPNFLQARDAILQADQVDTGGANLTELWAAFAKRGMGKSATSPASSTTTGLSEAYDVPFQPLQIVLSAGAAEGDGVLVGGGQVNLPVTVSSNVVVQLTSSDTSEVTLPASITIISGQTNASFNLTIVDDAILDGTQTATITASATGFANAYGTISVFDNETATLLVTLPGTATEGQGTVQGTVQVSAVPATNITVSLSSSDTTEIQVPVSVIIPAGQTSAVFTATIVDDNLIDGPQIGTVNAHVQNWTDGSAAITVADNENLNLTVSLPASAWENAGVLTNAGLVSISGTLATNLPVALNSAVPSKLIIPSTIIIPAGQASNTFNLTLVDNSIADGQTNVTATASAPGFTNGSASLLIMDDESPVIPFNPRPDNLATNVPANTNLMWSNTTNTSGTNEIVLNGGFEIGSLTNWTTVASTYGTFVINNGTVDPPSPDGPLPPFSGNYSALGQESGPGIFYTYQTVSIPSNTTSVNLSWAHRVRNFYSAYSSSQQFQVRICDTNNNVLATPFTTNPGDPLLGGWVQNNYNMAAFVGKKVRVEFWVNPGSYYMDTHVDSVSLLVSTPTNVSPSVTVTNDVYFGTNPTPGPAEFQGSTTNSSWTLPSLSPLTTYYWQVVAHKGGSATGPVWQFTTAGVDHFAWSTIPSPQYAGQPFGVTVTAKDAFNSIVSNFSGTASLNAGGGGGSGEIFRANFESGLQGFTVSNTFGLGNGLWHLSTGRAAQVGHTPSNSLYYGTGEGPNGGGTYNSGLANEGIITSPTIDLSTASAPLTLSFNCLIQSEPGTAWDHATVEISTNNGAAYAVICGNNQGGVLFGTDSSGLWITVSNNLSSYAGRQIKLRLHFNTVDSGANGYEGWYVDDLVIFSGATNTPIVITPTLSSLFTNGIWAGNITVQQPATNVVLRADDGNGHSGVSNPFDVVLTNDLSVSMVDSPDPVSVGANLTYTLTVANTGPLDATGVMVTNILPAGVNFVSAVSSQGTCIQNSNLIACNLGVVLGGTNATITLTVVPTIAGVTLTNVATVSRAEADNYFGNNQAVATTPVTMPAISVGDASVVEGNVGTTNVIFPVTLAVPSAQTITVNYATSNGSATAGSDYVATNGVLTFAPGVTNGTITVTATDDILVETNEILLVNLSSPVNGTLARAQAAGTIINDDGFPGEADHFIWGPIASPQFVGQYFEVALTALDASNNVATNFNGIATLSSTNLSISQNLPNNFTNGIWSGTVAVQPRATNITLRADDGNGHFGLSNPFDIAPTNLPPIILLQPTNQTVIIGGTTVFSVGADGTPTLMYQWSFNGTNISGATNAAFVLTNIQYSSAGGYAVSVTNIFGSAFSSNAILVVIPPPPCAPLPENLVSWWRGDGDASDFINGGSGVVYSGTSYSGGKVGQCFSFDGVSGCVMNTNTPPMTNIQNTFTIEFWAYPNAGVQLMPEGGGLGNSGQRYAIFPDWGGTDGKAGVGVCVGTNGIEVVEHAHNYMPSLLSYTNTLSGWVHVAVVYTSKQPVLYVNGVKVRTGLTSTEAFVYPSKDLGNSYASVSGFQFKTYGPYSGLLDEVSIYNRALESNEVAATYGAGSAGKCISISEPLITQQPTNQAAFVGGNASFIANASGTAPLIYQWQFNGTNISGATNTTLTLTNIQLAQAGTYALQVTNFIGATFSSNALLAVYAHHFAWSVIPSPQTANLPFAVALVAKDATNGTISNFTGTVSLYSLASNQAGVNMDFETGSLAPWTPLNLGNQPGPYNVVTFDVNGDGISSSAFRIAANAGTPDGITQNVQLTGGFTYTVKMDIATDDTSSGNNADGGTTAIVIGGTTVAQFGWGSVNIGNIYRTNLAGTFTPTSNGVYAVTLTFYRGYAEPSSLWCLADDLRITGPGNSVSVLPVISGGFSNGVWNGNMTALNAGTNVMLIADDGHGHVGASNPFNVTNPAPPVILTQPVSQAVLGGSNVSFTVAASGTAPLNYFWQKNNSPLLAGNIASLTLLNLTRTNSGSYNVIVSNFVGSVTSSNAILLVHVPQHLGTPVLLPNGALILSSSDVDGGVLSPADLANLQAQASTNLVDWTTLPNALMITNGVLQLQDLDSNNTSMRFYRIIENW